MSFTHPRTFQSLLGFRASLCVPLCAAALLGCGAGLDDFSASNGEDPSFGNGAGDGSDGTAGSDAGEPASGDGEGDGDDAGGVRVRFLHALVNVGPLTACHDPDRVVDQPDTAVDESDDGPLPAEPLALDGSFGQVSAYASLAPLLRGVVSFHAVAAPDLDGGVPDAGALDGGVASACAPETREAELALPFSAAPLLQGDLSGIDLASTLEGSPAITLFASGLALRPEEIESRVATAEASWQLAHPGDAAGAEAAGRARRVALLAARGVQVVPTRERSTRPGDVALSFAHLVPDVPSAQDRSGDLVLCAQAGDRELGQLAAPASMHFAFRLRAPLGVALDPTQAHAFRIFAAEAFDAEAKGCAATSLLPVATLALPSGSLESGRSYTLAALGAIGSDELCAPTNGDVLPREGCAGDAADFAARLLLVE